jgi:hypothetical protein
MWSLFSSTDAKQFAHYQWQLRNHGPEILRRLEKRWNTDAYAFVDMMRMKHLNALPVKGPSPYLDQLMRRSSNLFNAITAQVVKVEDNLRARVYFMPRVKDYAPVHEHGSPHVRARMHLRNEWKAWQERFRRSAMEVANEVAGETT